MLKENLPSANVFMLTVFEDEERIFDSVKAGALGYLLKKDAPEKIIEAVYAVHKGESIMNGRIARKMLDYFTYKEKSRAQRFEEYDLTRREKEILQLISDGMTNPQIAGKLYISLHTVDTHRKNLLAKFNVNNTAALIKLAAKHQLV